MRIHNSGTFPGEQASESSRETEVMSCLRRYAPFVKNRSQFARSSGLGIHETRVTLSLTPGRFHDN